MTNNITAQPGTETPIPCKPLVAILGWAMELQHTHSIPSFQETNNLLFETFIIDPSASDAQERAEVLEFYKEINELCNMIAGFTPEEITQLNQFLLSVCEKEVQSAAA
jgi:hypothetical protein